MQVHTDAVALLEHGDAFGLPVQSRVLDRDRRMSGQGGHGLLVIDAEPRSALLFGQIQIAQSGAAPTDRRPKEGVHRRMMRWEPDRSWVVLYLAQPQRVGLTLKESQQPQAVRQRADERAFLVGDARRDELFDRPALIK